MIKLLFWYFPHFGSTRFFPLSLPLANSDVVYPEVLGFQLMTSIYLITYD